MQTFVQQFAEDSLLVSRSAVPSPLLELVLTLIDGIVGALPHAVHHFDVLSADVFLLFVEPNQRVTQFD